jgi:hypothetical protein
MLTLHANHLDTLWDHLLPQGVRALPDDLARLDQVLADPGMLAPFRAQFQRRRPRWPATPCTGAGPPSPWPPTCA